MAEVQATLSYLVGGREGTIHRVITVEGVRQAGTERCNLDDVAEATVQHDERPDVPVERFCGWCFPDGV